MSEVVHSFLDHWGANISINEDVQDQLSTIEKTLELSLPLSYKALSLKAYKLFSPAIASQISCRDLEMYDIQDFIAVDEIIDETKAHVEEGMEKGYLAFGLDCMGNILCFKNEDLKNGKESVHVFDHAYCEMKELSPSFEGWLHSFNELKA